MPFLPPGERWFHRHNVALRLQVERAEWMGPADDLARLALLTQGLPGRLIERPLAVAFIGASKEPLRTVDQEVAFGDAGETPEAFLASYRGRTDAEYLIRGLELAEVHPRSRS
jgi:hypothetical protein